MATKQIPCRVCGTMFTPCAYCMSHTDTFRWRNFACSLKCAREYIAEATAAREKAKQPEVTPVVEEEAPKPKKKDKENFKSSYTIETAVVPPVPSYKEVNVVELPEIEVPTEE